MTDNDAFGFADDPEWSLELGKGPIRVYCDDNTRTVVYEQGGSHSHLTPARARELAEGLERGPDDAKRVVEDLREAADRIEGADQ